MPKHHYLIHGANALRDALDYIAPNVPETGLIYDPRSLKRYISLACNTLAQLLDDANAINLVNDSINHPKIDRRVELEEFLSSFLSADRELMIKSGLDSRMANYLFQDARSIILELRRKQPLEPVNIRYKLRDMRTLACEDKDEALARNSSKAIRFIRRATQVIGGGAIVVTNAASMKLLGDVNGSLSQALGGYIAGKGADG